MIDISGQRFGRLLAIEPTEKRVDKKVVWLMLCDCGTTAEVVGVSARSGNTQSCGCLQSERTKAVHAASRVSKVCPECSKAFTAKPSAAIRKTYCSEACMSKAYRARMRGASNPNYKGGITQAQLDANWRAKNREKVSIKNCKRRAAPGKYSEDDIASLLDRQEGRCAGCKCGLYGDHHVDHLIPVAKGGTSFVGNLQLLCPKCNLVKSVMLPIEFKHRVLEGVSEDAEQSRIMEWAHENCARLPELASLVHIPNGGYRSKRTAAKMQAIGVKRGVPDLNLPVARGGFHGLYIELKVGRNKPTAEQKAWLSALSFGGYKAVVCYGAAESIAVIEDYLS